MYFKIDPKKEILNSKHGYFENIRKNHGHT